MSDTFIPAYIAIAVSIIFTYLLFWLPSGKVRRYFRRRSGAYVTWAGMSLLLVLLSACGGSPSSNPPAVTPLALTKTPQLTTTTTPPSTTSTDWTTYHRNNQRTGYIASTPNPHSLSKIWSKGLDGAVYAEPLLVGSHLIVATEGDSLYALDPATGNVQWRTNVGTPVPLSSLPCGNIDPLGITGTPVYDPATGLVFAVAEITGPAHILVGLDVNTGEVKVRRLVDTDGMDPRAHQQRAALTLANGMVYIAYGGLDGDCSDYIGRVVASRTDGQGSLLVYRVPTTREAGIWATPGPSADAAGNIYVSVGNGESTSGQWDHSDSVLKLSPKLQLQDAFAPTSWARENAGDEDLGSQGPVLLPNNFIFAAGKSGEGYILNAGKLGGIGGQVDAQQVCHSYGGRMHTNHKDEFFIIDTEIRALEDEHRDAILSLRDTYEKLLQEVLRDGMERGVFRQCDVKISSYAIIAMCTEVATWFRPGGRLSVQQVIGIYSQMLTEGLLVTHMMPQTREESAHT